MVLAETTGTDTIYYLHGLDLVAQSDGTSTEYFVNDGLGSVRQIVDAAGETLLAQTYDPYGSLYASAGVDVTAFGYAGEQEDANGLVFLRARYYSPSMGRFLNMDPSRQEMNPYQYSYSNPVNYVDPSGLQSGDCFTDDCELQCASSLPALYDSCVFQCRYAEGYNEEMCIQDEGGCTWKEYQDLYNLIPRLRNLADKWNVTYVDSLGCVTKSTGIDDEVFVLIMAASLRVEGVMRQRNAWGINLPRRIINKLGDDKWINEGYPASMGIANLRPSDYLDILNNRYNAPTTYTDPQNQSRVDFYTGNRLSGYQWILNAPAATVADRTYLYNQVYNDNNTNLEFMAANILRGIERAYMIGINPSIFNIATWSNEGVQHPNNINEKAAKHANRVLRAAGHIASGKCNLGLALPQDIPYYNLNEVQHIKPPVLELIN